MAPQAFVVVDTNILIEIWRGRDERHLRATAALRRIHDENRILCNTSPIKAELLLTVRDMKEYNDVRRKLIPFHELHITEEASKLASEWVEDFAMQFRPSFMDLLIGAVANVHGACVLTFNQKDFMYLPGVALEQVR
jgi:predicted nucleic acid-binding protein